MIPLNRCSSFRRIAFAVCSSVVVVTLNQPVTANNDGGEEPAVAADSLELADGLTATLFAAEPMMLSPTNIDVDARGRVWVCEVVNYRKRNGERPEGDRILILEDTDGDGVADKRQVYFQGNEIDSALGIGVFGNQVIVSCSPNVWIFTDEDGDDRPDRKDLLFSRTGDPQHDHSAHAFTFGPDGKLYWNFGNTGKTVHDKDGNLIVDKFGKQVAAHGDPYRQGMAFRCNFDGSELEVLGYNFRNSFEIAVDSLGNLWQTDNDDDGNRAARVLFLMERGNYGFTDEVTGATWREPRTGMHPQIPIRHWHQRDPGVVPNMLQTGPGSPSGLCVYEGRLLPRKFWDQLIHCEPYYNVTRSYPVTKHRAGYTADIVNLVRGTTDKWFRPVDVCTAPDGSLFVADWYDPGVGGHLMGDVSRGRVFRIAPPGTAYQLPTMDLNTVSGAIAALTNPALSVRYLGWRRLHEWQHDAEEALFELFTTSPDKRLRARAFWLLGKIEGRGQHYVDLALSHEDEDFRILALRLARQLDVDLLPYLRQLVRDASPQVRRECAIALEGRAADAPELWAQLATAYDGTDRWYLEALGIGARGAWDACWDAYLSAVDGNWDTPPGREIAWRSRASTTPLLLAQLINDKAAKLPDLQRYLRALDFQQHDARRDVLTQLAFGESPHEAELALFVASEAMNRLDARDMYADPENLRKLSGILDGLRGTQTFIAAVKRFRLEDRYPELLTLAQDHADSQLGVDAIQTLLALGGKELIREQLMAGEASRAVATAKVLGTARNRLVTDLLVALVGDENAALDLRRRAMASLVYVAPEIPAGWAQKGTLPAVLQEATAAAFHSHPNETARTAGAEVFPLPGRHEPLPPVAELLTMQGDAVRGKQVFETTGKCITCHVAGKHGKDVGPALTDIGDKLTRQAILESILFPSAAVSHGYESYALQLEDGMLATGILVNDAADVVTLKEADGIERSYDQETVEAMIKQPVSLMPADLASILTAQELMDVVEYTTTLKKHQ